MEFKSSDGKTLIHGVMYQPNIKPIGMIQVVHGITEHIGRYKEMALYFNQLGYIVYGIDLIGHGDSLYAGHIKSYIPKWQNVVDDVYYCYSTMKQQYPNIPCYLLGFSMGSFIVRTLMIQKDLDIQGCFLLGTGYQNKQVLKVIRMIVNKQCKKNETESNDLINKLAIDTYNKKFKDADSHFSWLLANQESLKEYENDDKCSDYVAPGLFRELLTGMIYTENKYTLDIHYPVYLLSGKDDPVGDFSKGVIKTVDLLKSYGIKDVDYILYDHMRHDILHEKDHLKVYHDIQKRISKGTI